MSELQLRPYQSEAITALNRGWDAGKRRLVVLLPTGMGKTVIMAEIARLAIEQGNRTIVLVHRDELVKQTVKKMRNAHPDAHIGIVQAEKNSWRGSDVVVASVQTLSRIRRRQAIPRDYFHLVMIDECHHAAAKSYLSVLKHFQCFEENGGTLSAGFTATLSRNDEKHLGDVWEDIAYTRDILYGIENGFLVDAHGKQVLVDGLDLATVARSQGDYQAGSLGDKMISAGAGKVIAEAYLEHGKRDGEIRRGILFAPTVAAATSFACDMNAAGIVTEVVTGETPSDVRNAVYDRVRAGTTRVISSCMVLTEGFDLPEVEIAVIARCTSSSALYTQMVGRVLRPAPWSGKDRALVLDVTGVASRLKLATMADLSKTREVKPGESIAEAVARQASENSRPAVSVGRMRGAIGSREIELFQRSRSVWLQTYKGTWFIPTKSLLFLVWPTEGGFKAGYCPSNTTVGGKWVLNGVSLEEAKSWAERASLDADSSVSQRSSSWRRAGSPSDAQLSMLARYKINSTGMNRAAASDALSVHFASRVLDK